MINKTIKLSGEVGVKINYTEVYGLINGLGDYDELTIELTSEGGCSETGRKIYDYIKSLNKPVTIKAIDYVYSAGFTILMAGTNRIASNDQVRFLMHSPFMAGFFIGGEQETAQLHEAVKLEKQLLVNIYSSELNLEPTIIEMLMENDEVISANAALGLNMIHNISDEKKDVEPLYNIAAKGYINEKQKELLIKNENKMNEKLVEKLEENNNILRQFVDGVKSLFKIDIKAIKVATEEGQELEFDTETLEVGSAIINDAPDGTYTCMIDDKKYTVVIEGGKVTSKEEIIVEEENVEALKQQIADLQKKLNDMEETNNKALADVESLNIKLQDNEQLITIAKQFVTKFKQPDGTYKFEASSQTPIDEKKERKNKAVMEVTELRNRK